MARHQHDQGIIFAPVSRTTTQTSIDINTGGSQYLQLFLNVTSAGTGSITLSVNGKDPASNTYFNLLTGSAVTTNGFTRYRVGSFLSAVANSVALDYLPETIQVVVTANNANPVTYSVGYCVTG